MKYTVLRDTREQQGWVFDAGPSCEGTIVHHLVTGDYTIKGFENDFVIERKGTAGEFARNLMESRFDREMERLSTFKHSFIILEFTMAEIKSFPINSGIPASVWSKLHISPFFLLKRISEFEIKYPTKIIYAGSFGKEHAASLFKRMMEIYGTNTKKPRGRPRKNRQATSPPVR